MDSTMLNATLEKPVSFTEAVLTSHGDNGRELLIIGTGLLAVAFYIFDAFRSFMFEVKAPVVGYRSKWEPGWVVGMRFARSSGPMLRDGYQKFKDNMFKIRRNDCEVLIISRNYIDELRDMAEDRLSAIEAHLKNMVGRYTITNTALIRNSDLHRRTLQQKLTPALGKLIEPLKDELDFALETEIKGCEDWTPMRIHAITVGIVARISARIFVGPDLCRNGTWLYTSINFTKNVGLTRNGLRALPSFIRPIVAPFLSCYWRIYSNLSTAQRLIGPIIEERKANIAKDPNYEKPNDFLQWMIDDAKPHEGRTADLAHRQLLVSLASIHTTSLQVSHFIYDLCAHPEYAEPLREEIISVLREDRGFKKPTLNKLRKVDSFLKESQRMNPPLVMSFQRVVQKDLILKDGTKLTKGTHFAVASDAIAHDPENLPGGGDPDVFDPFRYAKLREDPTKPENANRYQFATTGSSDLHFGHGIYACPGRFFASNEIKLILCHLLLRYEFKYSEGQTRPGNLCYEEAMYPDPSVQVLMRKRAVEDPIVAGLVGV